MSVRTTSSFGDSAIHEIVHLLQDATLEETTLVPESTTQKLSDQVLRTMLSEGPCLSIEQFSERLIRAHQDVFIKRVVQLSILIYMMAKEKLCFQNLTYVGHLKKLIEISTSLKERGVQFFQMTGSLPTIAMFPEFDVRIPWVVLQLACRLQYLSAHKRESVHSPGFRQLIFDCFEAEERFPAYRSEIALLLDLIRVKGLREASASYLAPAEYSFVYWKNLRRGSHESKEAVYKFITVMSDHLQRFDAFEKEVRETVKTSPGMNEATKKLASKSLVIDRIFIATIEQCLALFQEKAAQEARCKLYARSYVLLKAQESMFKDAIHNIVLWSVEEGSPLRAPVLLTTDGSRYPPEIIEAIKAMDISVIPSPEEYAQPLRPFSHRCLVDLYLDEYRAQKEKVSFTASTSSSKPPGLLAHPRVPKPGKEQRKKKKPQRLRREVLPAVPSKCTCEMVPLPPEPPRIVIQEAEPPATHSNHDQEPQPLPIASAPCEEKQQPPQPIASTPCEEKQQPLQPITLQEVSPYDETDDQEGFLVRVNDGPDLSLRFIDHAGRWADARRDIFQEDPVYQSKSYSSELKAEIRCRHAFGRALIPVILRYGKRFKKVDARSGRERISYTMPGEIIGRVTYEKVVFTVSMNPKTGDIIHMYATQKSPLTLVMEYAKDGCFPANDDELELLHASNRYPSRASYTLPDDGSRITQVTDECISVTQSDGTLLNAYPFPDI